MDEDLILRGAHVRLEPLAPSHIDGLVRAAGADPSLYCWSPAPQGAAETKKYVETRRREFPDGCEKKSDTRG
jgi:hypothetical protein